MSNKFKIDYDKHGFQTGIKYGSFVVLQLNPGTVRNRQFAELIVEILNNHLEGIQVTYPDPVDEIKNMIRKCRNEKC